jgi:hypothetical protein
MKKVLLLTFLAAMAAACHKSEEERACIKHLSDLSREQKACVERQGCGKKACEEKKRECLKKAFRACGAPMREGKPAVVGNKVEVEKESTCG